MFEISSLAFLEIQKLPTFVRAFSICFSQVTHTLPPLFSVLTSHSLPLSLTLRKEEQQEVPSTKISHSLCHTHTHTQQRGRKFEYNSRKRRSFCCLFLLCCESCSIEKVLKMILCSSLFKSLYLISSFIYIYIYIYI
jgi:hypothetical protein